MEQAERFASPEALGERRGADRDLSRNSSAPPTASRAKSVVTKAIRDKTAATVRSASYAEQRPRLRRLVERRRAVAARDRTAALVTVARRRDRALSRREGPPRPARLRRPDRQDRMACSARVDAAWVHYKLDLGIDHVLIDEAQDTSPQAMADRRAWSASSSPATARVSVRAHDFRGRRREAVDLLVPGRGAARSSRTCARVRRRCRGAPATALQPARFEHSFRSGAERARRGRPGVRAAGRSSPA